MGKTLIFIGIIFIILGLIYLRYGNIFGWFGKLPGDIKIEKENFILVFPLTSGILISLLLSIIFWVLRIFFNK